MTNATAAKYPQKVNTMNILILNGSPRKQGITSQMLAIMQTEAEKRGDKVETVTTNTLNIKPCIGCKVCRTKGKCVLGEDDSQRVLQMMQNADAIIIGAPCYWGNIPGQMKVLFDRIVYGLMRDTPRFPEPLMKGKKCILVSASTTPWPFNILFNQSHGAIRALREICHYSGFKIIKTLERGYTANITELTEKDKQKCKKAIAKLV
jgi:putative NADPH-quinone reductase